MKEQNEWVFFRDIDWDDVENNVFSIDTRDFHCGYRFEDKEHESLETLKKYKDRFFFTKEELVSLIERYYNESGGECKWRFFNLKGIENWSMKYIRIWRTKFGFIVCNSDNYALNKEILSSPVDSVI